MSEFGTEYWETHCSRCSDELLEDRESRICESCERSIQLKKLCDGVRCDRCDGRGYVYGTICDVQRAMNGRNTLCPECHGTGRMPWDPEPDDVHPDLRTEVRARA